MSPGRRRLLPRRPTPVDARPATPWPHFETAPPVLFLDVDGTLLAETTSYLFARILRRRGLLRRSFLIRALYHGLQHKFGRLDYGRLIEYGLQQIGQLPVVDLERIAYDNFAEQIRPRLYEGVVDHLNDLRGRGTQVVLVSSSPALVLEPLSLYLGCAGMLTTQVRVAHGKIVGIGEGPACYGEGKRYWADLWASARGISMDDAAAYADNWSDRALLQQVGHPVVVHPRGKLRTLAVRQGWQIVYPRRPREAST